MDELEFKYYVSDMMGTIAPENHVKEIVEYSSRKDVIKKIAQQSGKSVEEIAKAIDDGKADQRAGNKDSPAFKQFLKYTDLGSQIGYQNGELKLGLENNVRETLEYINKNGGSNYVFASAASKSTKAGCLGVGLDSVVSNYFSSSDVGSKNDKNSYQKIADQLGINISEMVYVTDTDKEAKAAAQAGVGKVFLIDRKQNQGSHKDGYTIIHNYSEVAKQTTKANYAKASYKHGAKA